MKDILAVIVTYYPNVKQVEDLVATLRTYGVGSVIVDNTPGGKNIDIKYCHIIYNGNNLGIALAQNVGIEYGISKGVAWFWFFDQDSMVSGNLIDSFYRRLNNQLLGDKIYAPIFYDEKEGFEYPIVNINPDGSRKKITSQNYPGDFYSSVVISSGTLVNSEVFNVVGKMNESLFIDYVDTEWCLRCAHNGIPVRIVNDAKMLHSIGERSIPLFGFRIPVHSAVRRYYRIRNSIELFRMPHVPNKLAFREISFSLIHQLILCLYVKDKKKHIKYLFWGVWDGVFRNLGICKR